MLSDLLTMINVVPRIRVSGVFVSEVIIQDLVYENVK